MRPINVNEDGTGYYAMEQEPRPTEKPEGETVERVRREVITERKLPLRQRIRRVGVAVALLVGGGLAVKSIDFIGSVAPEKQREITLDDFQRALEAKSSVANGEVKSSASVHSEYSYLLGNAHCNFELHGSQQFVMTPKEGGDNITLDREDKEIRINLSQNPIDLDPMKIEAPSPEDCDANRVGSFFDDDQKAFSDAVDEAPRILKKRTEVDTVPNLLALEDNEAGMAIASAAAGTYASIAQRTLDLVGADYDLVFEFQGEPVQPVPTAALDIPVDGGRISVRG